MVQLTLSERVTRIENILVETGVAGDRNASHPQMGIGDKTDRWDGDSTIAAQVYQQKMEAHKRDTTEKVTSFEEIIQRISSCNDRVCLTADKLQKIGDRIMGYLPETASGDDTVNPQRGTDGTLDHTFMALNWLDQSLNRLEQVALRMERV